MKKEVISLRKSSNQQLKKKTKRKVSKEYRTTKKKLKMLSDEQYLKKVQITESELKIIASGFCTDKQLDKILSKRKNLYYAGKEYGM